MFTPTVLETYKLDDLFDAWASAARDAKLAWDSWLTSATRDRGDAYVSYRASLDREEHAAEVLTSAVRSGRRGAGSRDGWPVELGVFG